MSKLRFTGTMVSFDPSEGMAESERKWRAREPLLATLYGPFLKKYIQALQIARSWPILATPSMKETLLCETRRICTMHGSRYLCV